jgi:predicted dehydrogenase
MPPSSLGSPVRLGVVGAGRFATFLTGAVADLPDVAVHVVTDRDAEAAALLAKAYDARIVPSWQEMLDDPSVDVVVVATPPASHAEIAREALWCG